MLACGHASVAIRWSDQGRWSRRTTRAGWANWASVTQLAGAGHVNECQPGQFEVNLAGAVGQQRAERVAEGAAAVDVGLAVEEQPAAARELPDSERASRTAEPGAGCQYSIILLNLSPVLLRACYIGPYRNPSWPGCEEVMRKGFSWCPGFLLLRLAGSSSSGRVGKWSRSAPSTASARWRGCWMFPLRRCARGRTGTGR